MDVGGAVGVLNYPYKLKIIFYFFVGVLVLILCTES